MGRTGRRHGKRVRAERQLADALRAGALLAAAGGAALAARHLAAARGEQAGAAPHARPNRLRRGEPLALGLQRVALARADAASARLGGSERERAINAARKDLEKLRATVRLAARVDRGGRVPLRAADCAARHAGRLLAGELDEFAKLATLASLQERFEEQPPGEQWRAWRAALEAERAEQSREARDRAVSDALAAVARSRAAIEAWRPARASGAKRVRTPLRRSYGAGRRAMTAARSDGRPGGLHEWHKRVRQLEHQLRLVRRVVVAPEPVSAARARVLAELLGEHRDLELLRLDLRSRPALGDRAALERLIERRQEELRIQALVHGSLLYALAPRVFADRLRAPKRGRRRA